MSKCEGLCLSKCDGLCPSVTDYVFPVVLLMAWVTYQGVFFGWEVDKTMDDFVHHHGLSYCSVITNWLGVQFRDTSGGSCVGALVLRGVPGSSPLGPAAQDCSTALYACLNFERECSYTAPPSQFPLDGDPRLSQRTPLWVGQGPCSTLMV